MPTIEHQLTDIVVQVWKMVEAQRTQVGPTGLPHLIPPDTIGGSNCHWHYGEPLIPIGCGVPTPADLPVSASVPSLPPASCLCLVPRRQLSFPTTSCCASIRRQTTTATTTIRITIIIIADPLFPATLPTTPVSQYTHPSELGLPALHRPNDIRPRGTLPSRWAPFSLFPPSSSLQLLHSGQSEHHVVERLRAPCCVGHAACPNSGLQSLPELLMLSYFWSIVSWHGSCSLLGLFENLNISPWTT